MGIIGEQTKRRRSELGLSQNQLVTRINDIAGKVICSQPKLGQLENGETQQPRYIFELAQALGVTVDWLRGRTLNERGAIFAAHPDVAAASEARAHKLDIARAITAEPELFAALLGKYRQIYQEEGVAITEEDLAILTLNDYAQLITEFDTTEERRHLANGFVVKQRGWLRQNKGAIKAGT